MGSIVPLSEREKQVLTCLTKGLLNKEISSQLNISIDTVKKHNKNIYKKIGVRNRVEAIVHVETTNENN